MNAPGISAAITLTDRMTPVLQNVISAMNVMVNSAGKVDNATKNMFSTSDLNAVRSSLLSAEVGMRQIEEETKKAQEAQRRYNEEASKSGGIIGDLKNKVVGLASAYAGMRAVKAFVGMSDQMSQIKARLGNMNDGLQTTDGLMQQIYQSAQRSRGDFMMTADIVAKLGTQAKNAFGNNQETIQFAEGLNKIFTLDGTDPSGVQSVMYNLTQAMATGVLRGQDLNAVMSNAPRLMEIVANHLGTGTENIRKLAEEGKLSSKVIKDALLGASGDINKEFEKMPMTFGQIMQSMKNQFIMAMQPAFNAFNKFLNSERFQRFAQGVANAMGVVATGISFAVQGLITVASFAFDIWDKLKVPILIVAGAIVFYKTALLMTTAVEAVASAGKFLLALATGQATIAQLGLNSAMLASPIFWIPLAIMGVIYALTLLTKHIYHVEGASYSAIAGVVGALSVAGAFVINLAISITNRIIGYIIILYNRFAHFANFIGNVFKHPVAAVKALFFDLLRTIVGVVQVAAQSIDTLLGTNLSGSISGLESKIEGRRNKVIADSGYKEYVKDISLKDNMIKRVDYKGAYNWGYNKGLAFEQKAKKVLSPNMPKVDTNQVMPVNPATAETMKNAGKPGKETAKNSKKTADNTKKIKDKLDNGIDIKNEDLKYLRELATSRAISQYSLDKVMVEVNNSFGDVHERADLDGWQSSMADGLVEAIHKSVGGAGLATT